MENKPFIVFDFGNVLLDIDYSKTLEAFNELLGQSWTQETIPSEVKDWIKKLESGKISGENFVWHIQSKFGPHLNPKDIISAWNALLLQIPKGRTDWLKNLRSNYKTALLSNTNAIHLEWVNRHLKADHNIDIEIFDKTCFDYVFYSNVVKLRKPDAEIYDLVETVVGIKGNQILFIDDLAKNIVGARASDWTAVQHIPSTNIESELNTYIDFWSFMMKEEAE